MRRPWQNCLYYVTKWFCDIRD